ncbi:MAG TPA: glycosyltransferase family A protein, partial [Verrucomicrobiae bacterium]|nr:glycosyltransferase family A protein [Verrucomicrobiae bacterium]
MWIPVIFGITAGLFLFWALSVVGHLRWVQRLPALETLRAEKPSDAPIAKPIRCSVVIAARDEELRIEQTLRRLFAQHGVEAEFIVVDDRSSDGTPEILRRLALEEARLRVIRVDVLPPGWLGKCHACHLGASAARGDWILFTDADCWLQPDVIARAVCVADRAGADHITMASGLARGS